MKHIKIALENEAKLLDAGRADLHACYADMLLDSFESRRKQPDLAKEILQHREQVCTSDRHYLKF